MTTRVLCFAALATAAALWPGVPCTPAQASDSSSHHHHGRHDRTFPGGIGGYGVGWFGPPVFVTIGPNGPIMLTPAWASPPILVIDRGPVGGPLPAVRPPAPTPAPTRKPDPTKSGQLVTIGDRLFRAGNLRKASERYEQAAKADPDSASPRVRMAQVALVRGQFAEAAERFREAVAAEPGWLAKAPNIEAVFGEPADFRRQIARLETRVLAEPGDRDAWLVLGAELFLNGQTRRAADVFLRLTDRKPDAALSAFLEASRPEEHVAK